MARKLTIATCQHAVSGDIEKNTASIMKQMKLACSHLADIAHFSECNLSGYAGIDFSSYDEQNEKVLRHSIEIIRNLARQLRLWVIIGSHHFMEKMNKPYNSLFLINDHGEIAARYDKRFLAGASGEMDQKHYSPGTEAVIFELKGIKCGFLICHEWRYPELYREYKRLNADIIFQSWYDGNISTKDYEKEGKELGELIIGTVKGNAANNYLWISGSNTSMKESCYPSFVIQPDGKILHRLKRNLAGVLISKIDMDKKYTDPSEVNRNKIFSGGFNHVLH